MIAGLEHPDAGEISFDGAYVFSREKGVTVPPERRGLGFVFQDFALWPHMTVFENVAFGLRAQKKAENLTARVAEALEAVRLVGYEKRYPHQLSGGQQQRVAFARAIVIRPRCILFDEPLSALDALLREEMRAELKLLTKNLGITSVFVTHDQTEAMSLSDRIAVFKQGTLLQYDTPEAIYRAPADPFVARFVGKSNWLDEAIMVRPEKMSLSPIEGAVTVPMKVSLVQYMGDGYEVTLSDADHTWHFFTRTRPPAGERALVHIKREDLITFKGGTSA